MPEYNNNPDLIKIIADLQARVEKLEKQNVLQRATIDIGNNAGAQDAGLKVVDGKTGLVQLEMGGTITPRRPDNTPQPFFRLKRDDGTVALELIDRDPFDAGGYRQIIALYDRQGNKILGDDVASGFGLSYPFIHYPLPATSIGSAYSSSFTDQLSGGITISSPRLRATINSSIYGGAGTATGEARLLIDGVVVGGVQAFTVGGQVTWIVDLTSYALNSAHTLTVQARTTSSSSPGTIGLVLSPFVVRSDST